MSIKRINIKRRQTDHKLSEIVKAENVFGLHNKSLEERGEAARRKKRIRQFHGKKKKKKKKSMATLGSFREQAPRVK